MVAHTTQGSEAAKTNAHDNVKKMYDVYSCITDDVMNYDMIYIYKYIIIYIMYNHATCLLFGFSFSYRFPSFRNPFWHSGTSARMARGPPSGYFAR